MMVKQENSQNWGFKRGASAPKSFRRMDAPLDATQELPTGSSPVTLFLALSKKLESLCTAVEKLSVVVQDAIGVDDLDDLYEDTDDDMDDLNDDLLDTEKDPESPRKPRWLTSKRRSNTSSPPNW